MRSAALFLRGVFEMAFDSIFGLDDFSTGDLIVPPFQLVVPIDLGITSALELDGPVVV